MSLHTVVDWNSYLRDVCAWKLEQNLESIGGPGMTVEIDESLFSKRKNNAGRVLPTMGLWGYLQRNKRMFYRSGTRS